MRDHADVRQAGAEAVEQDGSDLVTVAGRAPMVLLQLR